MDDLRNRFEHTQYWSDDVWKNKMAGGGGNNKRFQYCTDPSGQEILYLRALQGHQEAILLIFNCRTMYLFRTTSKSTFYILDVQSIYTPSQIQD